MALSAHLTLKNSLKLSPNIEQSVNLLKSNEIEIELLINDFLSKNPYLQLDDSEKINLNYSANVIENNEENERKLISMLEKEQDKSQKLLEGPRRGGFLAKLLGGR